MNFFELVKQTRSCRRFKQDSLPEGFLDDLIEIARLCPSGQNKQPLRFITIEGQNAKNSLFTHLRWAGHLKEWDGPEESERPVAYIAIVLDKTISGSAGQDTGITAQTMQLASMHEGVASCMIGAFIKPEVEKVLDLNKNHEIQLILALGYPLEERVIVDITDEADTAYYRDENMTHYVPKRKIESLLINKK